MKESNMPTIEEISSLFIPNQFKDHFIITEITPEEIFVNAKKGETPESKIFLKQFLQITKMVGLKGVIQ